jgi:hypothetical protein
MPDLQQPPDVSAATPINRILAQAAAAAFANRREEAHEFLQQAIRQAPSSPEVWLACAALAGDPIERLAYLERACALNPTDTRAKALAGRARVQVINQLTEQGIAAVRDKSMGAARQHFAEIVRLEPTHEVTWLRLAALAESPEEQVALIKQVLRINPANEKARLTLVDAEKQLAQTHLKQASAEIEAGQYANARAALRRSLQLDAASEDAWSLMALIAEDADERQNAADRLDALRAAQLVAAAPPAEPEPAATPAPVPVTVDPPPVAAAVVEAGAAPIEFQLEPVVEAAPAIVAASEPVVSEPVVPEPLAVAGPPALPVVEPPPVPDAIAPVAAIVPEATVVVEASIPPVPVAVEPPPAPAMAHLLPVDANIPTITPLGQVIAGPPVEAIGGEGPFFDRRAGDRRIGGRRAADYAAAPPSTGPARSARRCARRPPTSARPAAASPR